MVSILPKAIASSAVRPRYFAGVTADPSMLLLSCGSALQYGNNTMMEKRGTQELFCRLATAGRKKISGSILRGL
jgi:hypothetical protein